MWGVFWHNLPLTKYLISEVSKSFDDRMDALRVFVKDAKNEDWEVLIAGQRVQTIKKDEFEGGKLEFGTEIVSSSDGKITCLLGASPGASTSVQIMMEVIEKAFPEITNSVEGKRKIEEMMPSYKKDISKEQFLYNLEKSTKSLKLA